MKTMTERIDVYVSFDVVADLTQGNDRILSELQSIKESIQDLDNLIYIYNPDVSRPLVSAYLNINATIGDYVNDFGEKLVGAAESITEVNGKSVKVYASRHIYDSYMYHSWAKMNSDNDLASAVWQLAHDKVSV